MGRPEVGKLAGQIFQVFPQIGQHPLPGDAQPGEPGLQFPERPGALHDFLALLRGTANLCYFNYSFSGELVGRALIGFEFASEDERAAFKKSLADSHHAYREISQDVLKRVL